MTRAAAEQAPAPAVDNPPPAPAYALPLPPGIANIIRDLARQAAREDFAAAQDAHHG